MYRTLVIAASAVFLIVIVSAGPAGAIIHEIVASHCAGHPVDATVDPPGQLNQRGNAFARALQVTGVYDLQFGVSQAGVLGQDLSEMPPDDPFELLPPPPGGTTPLTVLVDNTRRAAKLGDEFIWVFFVEGDLAVYLQIYDLDHPAFEHCPKIHP